MKTAEEILDKRLNYQQNKNLYYYEVYSEILQAMGEYANQVTVTRTDTDHDKQTQFRRILDKHLLENKVYLTSNELHTLFDACMEFINLYQNTPKN